jgi:hypothetical protein
MHDFSSTHVDAVSEVRTRTIASAVEMPSKAQCWVVSYARRRADGSRDGASKEGLLTVPKESSVMLLHTHPDGARLAHGAYTPGLSPGKRMSIGDYDCELLMLSPHGGGGNPAYAAAFVRPGEVLPNMTPYKEEGWLEWLGLDDLHEDGDSRVPVVLRAPHLPSANDPQPTTPISFAPSNAYRQEDRYEQQRRERDAYEHERNAQSTRTADTHYQQQPQQPQPQQHEQYHYQRHHQHAQPVPAQTVGGALMAASAPVTERMPSADHRYTRTPASVPVPAPTTRPRESVFHDEYVDDDEAAFAEDVRFDPVREQPVQAVTTPTIGGTSDELDALRAKLAELERLTGTTVEEAERALEADLVKTREIVPDLLVVDANEAAPLQEPASASSTLALETPKSPPMAAKSSPPSMTSVVASYVSPARNVAAPVRERVQHVPVIEVPPAISVSANIFKTNASHNTTQAQITAIKTVAEAEIPPPLPTQPVPQVRATPQVVKSIPAAPKPSVLAVTPEEVDANDAWAAAVARRNRSVDDDESGSSDVDDDAPSRAPAKVVHVVSTSSKNTSATLNVSSGSGSGGGAVSTRTAMFENGSTPPKAVAPPLRPPAAAPKPSSAQVSEPDYGSGSVAARASIFGEQTSVSRRRD